ncbi:RecE-like exonuclease [Mycobacterium phage Sejanus]|nr:RecE-like exonuclease [Mycobacterium phage Sejanus]
MTAPEQDGLFTRLSEDAYRADLGILSVSSAKLLLPPSCPAKFRWEQDNKRKPKKEWDFGHVTHHLVLGKGAEFEVLDPAVHGLKANGEPSEKPTMTTNWKKAVEDARERGKVPISLDDYTKAQAMAAEVFRHPEAARIFAEGNAEVSLFHTDPETGMRLRGRCDWIEPDGDIDDYKTSTTANPAELKAKFYRLGYYMQAAWYIDLAVAVGASESPRFRFVVQEKEPPYVVTVVEYDEESIEQGRRANRQAIRLYADCLERGEWPGYSDSVVTISLPKYALQDGIQDEADALIAELEGIYQ